MVGSLGLTIVAALHGCGGDQPPAEPNKAQTPGAISEAAKGEGVFMVIQQTGANPDTYELKEKYPSSEGTRAILKGMDGKERILNEAELKQIADAEAKKVEAGSSKLTQPVAQNQGMGLGETILASAAGALVGGMIANKLMGNSNYQQHQQYQQQHARTNPPSSYQSRPAGGMGGAPSTSSQPKSGFFGGGSSRPSSGSTGGSFFGGGSFGG
jgi:hypothetical protein